MFNVVKDFTCRAALFLFMLLLSQQASAWWNDKWPYRAPITLDTSITGANIESTQMDIPVLVRLHAGNFQDFFLLKEDMSDIRFVANDDKTPLKHSVEHVDLINQMIFIWVKVPQLTAGIATEQLWMYYGNAEAVNAADAAAVYDAEQVLGLTFSPAEAPFADKTAYASAVENQGVTPQPAGLIAGAAKFEGNQFLHLQDSPALRMLPEKGMTFSAWIKPAGGQVDGVILSRVSASNSLSLALNGNILSAELKAGGTVASTPKTTTLQTDAWQHVALILTAKQLSIFINGAEAVSTPVQWPELGGNTYIGAAAGGARGFVGEMDEVRIDRVARSSDWLRTATSSQGIDEKLMTVQQAEQLGSGGDDHSQMFAVIINSLDAAGWAVIFILAIMAVITWAVTIGKSWYIHQASKDNQRFLEQYKQLAGKDPAMLDAEESEEDKALADSPIAQAFFGKHDHFQSSPIYHLYHRGIQEIRGRLGSSVGARATGLSPHAVEAIRASLDSDMTREIQRLNGKMVTLTIAVSGGPFLGLLGTVIGVMITFGAIAATGDVNIAAIAPGVAAALAATVAGLIVAIPALFAYNYLALRIKDQVVDMRVFIDEFIARIAEYYGQ